MASRTRKRDWLAFDAGDRLALQALLLLTMLWAAGYWIAQPIWDWARDNPLQVPYSGPVDLPQLDGTGLTATDAEFVILLPDPTVSQRLLSMLPGLLAAAVVLAVAWLLRRVLADVASGEPFRRANVRRLRIISLTIMVGWSLAGLAAAMVMIPILEAADMGELPLGATWVLPVVPIGIGMVLALMAEAFKVGAGLRDDVDGLG